MTTLPSLRYSTGPYFRSTHTITNEEIYFWILEQSGCLGQSISTESTKRGGFVWQSGNSKKTIRFGFSDWPWPFIFEQSQPPKKLFPVVLKGTATNSIFISDGADSWSDSEIRQVKVDLEKLGMKTF